MCMAVCLYSRLHISDHILRWYMHADAAVRTCRPWHGLTLPAVHGRKQLTEYRIWRNNTIFQKSHTIIQHEIASNISYELSEGAF